MKPTKENPLDLQEGDLAWCYRVERGRKSVGHIWSSWAQREREQSVSCFWKVTTLAESSAVVTPALSHTSKPISHPAIPEKEMIYEVSP
jgi:hypothetical protein